MVGLPVLKFPVSIQILYNRQTQHIKVSSSANYVHSDVMCLIMKTHPKGESGFLQVKCNKSKLGKSVLQPGILFVCIKLTFLIYLLPVISDCISILMMYKWKMFRVKSHGNVLKITLTCFFSLFLSCCDSGRLYFSPVKMISALSE